MLLHRIARGKRTLSESQSGTSIRETVLIEVISYDCALLWIISRNFIAIMQNLRQKILIKSEVETRFIYSEMSSAR